MTSFSGAARCAASWPKMLPRLLAEVARDLRALAGHPAGDGDGRDRADALEALLDDRVERLPRLGRAPHHVAHDVVAALP